MKLLNVIHQCRENIGNKKSSNEAELEFQFNSFQNTTCIITNIANIPLYFWERLLEECGIVGGLVGVQFLYAGNSVLMSFLMSLGIHPFTLVIFFSLSTFLFVSPIALYFERHNWPHRLGFKLVSQLILISFGWVTLFQSFFLKGIQLTSPSLATAMLNLAPGLIFAIAWIFRIEKVRVSCIYTKIKILGTFLCVIGAFTMSIMHSTSSDAAAKDNILQRLSIRSDRVFDEKKTIGCVYLFFAVVVFSSVVVLQEIVRHSMSLCAITSLFGMLLTMVVQIVLSQKLYFCWSLLSVKESIAYCVLGGIVSGACVRFNGWVITKRGPVLVSMFSPIATVCSLVLSVLTFKESINIRSLAGMFLMFTGLYFVLLAKAKEGYANRKCPENELDVDRPLLS